MSFVAVFFDYLQMNTLQISWIFTKTLLALESCFVCNELPIFREQMKMFIHQQHEQSGLIVLSDH